MNTNLEARKLRTRVLHGPPLFNVLGPFYVFSFQQWPSQKERQRDRDRSQSCNMKDNKLMKFIMTRELLDCCDGFYCCNFHFISAPTCMYLICLEFTSHASASWQLNGCEVPNRTPLPKLVQTSMCDVSTAVLENPHRKQCESTIILLFTVTVSI